MLLKTLLNRKSYCFLVNRIARYSSSESNETLELAEKLAIQIENVKDNSTKNVRLKEIHRELDGLIKEYKELKAFTVAPDVLDRELAKEALEDLEDTEVSIVKLLKQSSRLLIPSYKFDKDDAVLEVRAGAGGLEAGVFAGEILKLYLGYANYHGFEANIFEKEDIPISKDLKSSPAPPTALTRVYVKGDGVFRAMKYECGVHRVQRVPVTGSKNDRIHTSTCSVSVYPRPNLKEIHVDEKDCDINFVLSGGPGGQNVQKNKTACRLTYLPTGQTMKISEGRSAEQNKQIALNKVKESIHHDEYMISTRKTNRMRKSQIGNMNRNEKIRSYNFNRHDISDDRLKIVKNVQNISKFLQGGYGYGILDGFHESLEDIETIEALKGFLEQK